MGFLSSVASSIFGGGGKSSRTTTQTTQPFETPEAREMREFLFPRIKARVEEEPFSEEYMQQVIAKRREDIEAQSEMAKRRLTTRLATQGVRGPYAASQFGELEKESLGNITSMMRDISLSVPEEKRKRIAEALSFVYGSPMGQTTTTVGPKPNIGPEIAGSAVDLLAMIFGRGRGGGGGFPGSTPPTFPGNPRF